MAKNIQWKKSTLDYDKLNKLTPGKLAGSNNAKNVDRVKLGKILSKSYKNNPEMQATLKQNASDTHKKLHESGYYKSEKYLEIMKANGNACVESGQWKKVQEAGTKASIKSRINKSIERKLKVLNHIPFGVEFSVSKDLKPICIELNEVNRYWNKVVGDSDLVKKVYNGTSRIDPPRYIRIKQD